MFIYVYTRALRRDKLHKDKTRIKRKQMQSNVTPTFQHRPTQRFCLYNHLGYIKFGFLLKPLTWSVVKHLATCVSLFQQVLAGDWRIAEYCEIIYFRAR